MDDFAVRFSNVRQKTKSVIITSICVKEFNKNYDKMIDFVKSHNNYVVKHCDNPSIPTHITKDGMVNRYGFLVISEPLDFKGEKSIDFPKGVYQKETWASLEEVINFLEQ